MPKKRTNPRKPAHRPQGPPAGGRTGPRAIAPALVDFHALRQEYLAWVTNTAAAEGADVEEMWQDAGFLVLVATEQVGVKRLGDWTPAVVRDLVNVVREMDDDPRLDPDEEVASMALPNLLPLLAFLAETGRWVPSPGDLSAVQDTLTELMEELAPGSAVMAALDEVSVEPEVEAVALAAMPLLAQVEALLRWVGRRRAVTTTGALRRADIAPAAALVGATPPASASASMWEVSVLARIWSALQEAELLRLTKSSASPTDVTLRWLAGESEAADAARRGVAVAYLALLLTEPAARPWLPSASDILVPALTAGTCGQPVPMAALDLDAAAELTGAEPGLLASLFGSGADPQRLQALVMEPAVRRLERLRDDGFVRLGETIEVTPGLRGVLAEVLTGVLAQAMPGSVDRAEIEEPQGPPPLVYRLRIDLRDAAPAVWRQVEVDPRTSLGDLHDVIQTAMGWDDGHLHSFRGRGVGKTQVQYSCAEFGLDDEDAVEEHAVTIGEVLTSRRPTLEYWYDFGDDWFHDITLEGADPVAAGSHPPLPRCTAGGGACPQEDSGGVWGWQDMLVAVADPKHPEHAELRGWLGLEPGAVLDPTAFDLPEADRRVGLLREA